MRTARRAGFQQAAGATAASNPTTPAKVSDRSSCPSAVRMPISRTRRAKNRAARERRCAARARGGRQFPGQIAKANIDFTPAK
jgi:hypothetical protein